MTTTYDLVSLVNDTVRRHIRDNMTETNAQELGLDPRAGHRLYVDDCSIVVARHNDKWLQYYGGFEYVDKECRYEMGEYVFYVVDDSEDCRVSTCLQSKKEKA